MISWLKQFIKSFSHQPSRARTSADSARARVGATGARRGGAVLSNSQPVPAALIEEGKTMLKIKMTNPDMSDIELARRVDRRLDYVHKALAAARNSYIPS
jgi:hypothetical protein